MKYGAPMRSPSHALPALLCLLLAPLAHAQAPSEGAAQTAAGCPAERRVRFDPATWVKQLRAAHDVEGLQSQLTRVGLEPIDATCPEGAGERPWFSAVNAFDARIDPQARAVRVVNVLGGLCAEKPASISEAAPEFQRGAVFVAIGKGEWCRLDAPFLNAQGSAWGPSLCVPTVFGFESLVSPDHKALAVTEKQEWCGGSGSSRGDSEWRGYYEVRGFALHELLRLQLREGRYHTGAGVGLETVRRVTMKGEPPKLIDVQMKRTCLTDDAEKGEQAHPLAESYACTPAQARSVFRYHDGRYQEEAP